MSDWIDTTGLPITSVSENSAYRNTNYAKPCSSGFADSLSIESAIRTVTEQNGNKQAIYTLECGCQLISELVDKSLEGKAQK